MIVGGSDLVLFAPSNAPVADLILGRIRRLWPDSQVQDVNEDARRSIRDPRVVIRGGLSKEFLIYRDQDAVDAWDRDGATLANLNTMLYFIIGDASQIEEGLREVTLVCGEQTREVQQLVRDLEASFQGKPYPSSLSELS
ncbi:MAG: hypothetical protein ABI353_04575 [Isosphaeraceae bacterium]